MRTLTPPRRGYSIPELASAWSVSRQHLYDLARTGELRTFRIGERLIVPVDEVERIERGDVEFASVGAK